MLMRKCERPMCQLAYVHFATPQLAQMRAFYETQMGLGLFATPSLAASQYENIFLRGPQGLIELSAGPVATLREVGFEVFSQRWDEASERLRDMGALPVDAHAVFAKAFSLTDPEGNPLVFGCEPRFALSTTLSTTLSAAMPRAKLNDPVDLQVASFPPPARLQHVGLGARALADMINFYQRRLGLALSDDVSADDGTLRSSFLRGNEEHHLLALFGNGKAGFDHMSFEAPDWNGIRDWADHFAKFGTRIFWGAGRHGVGNNLFIFVLDPDEHMVEISAELERVPWGKLAGHWAFDYKAFNMWGPAALRV